MRLLLITCVSCLFSAGRQTQEPVCASANPGRHSGRSSCGLPPVGGALCRGLQLQDSPSLRLPRNYRPQVQHQATADTHSVRHLEKNTHFVGLCNLLRDDRAKFEYVSLQWVQSSQAASGALQEEQTSQRFHLLCCLEPVWAAAGYRLQ